MEEEEVLTRIHDIIASVISVDDFKVVRNETGWRSFGEFEVGNRRIGQYESSISFSSLPIPEI